MNSSTSPAHAWIFKLNLDSGSKMGSFHLYSALVLTSLANFIESLRSQGSSDEIGHVRPSRAELQQFVQKHFSKTFTSPPADIKKIKTM